MKALHCHNVLKFEERQHLAVVEYVDRYKYTQRSMMSDATLLPVPAGD